MGTDVGDRPVHASTRHARASLKPPTEDTGDEFASFVDGAAHDGGMKSRGPVDVLGGDSFKDATHPLFSTKKWLAVRDEPKGRRACLA